MALTGGLYLFKELIDSQMYALRFVEPTAAPVLDAESLVANALAAEPGSAAVWLVAPLQVGHSVEVGFRKAGGAVSAYPDPSSGRVLGELLDDFELMEVVKSFHSLKIAGTVTNRWIEIVAGWAIVLVVSGIFLRPPRGRSSGVDGLRPMASGFSAIATAPAFGAE